jgi:hypothetical protein
MKANPWHTAHRVMQARRPGERLTTQVKVSDRFQDQVGEHSERREDKASAAGNPAETEKSS